MKNSEKSFQSEAAKSLRMYAPEDLEKTMNSIREAYKIGLIESDDVDRFLLDFKFRDSAQRYWTIGIQTGKWYCNTNSGWVESARPPQRLEAQADLELASYVKALPPPPPPQSPIQQPTTVQNNPLCPRCGNSNNPKYCFCTKCGAPLLQTNK